MTDTTLQTAQATQAAYDPDRLFDTLRQRLQLHSDKALAKLLQIAPPLLARLRQSGVPVSGSLLMRIHDATGIAIDELRRVLGDRRQRLRLSFANVNRAALPA